LGVFSKKFAVSPPIRGFRVGTKRFFSAIFGVTRGEPFDTPQRQNRRPAAMQQSGDSLFSGEISTTDLTTSAAK